VSVVSAVRTEQISRVAHPKVRRLWKRRRTFLRRFVDAGDLVFDVGANCGDYTLTFVELNARPVAIEPYSESADRIRDRVPGVPVIEAAASDAAGMAELLLGARDADATISPRYGRILERELGVTLFPVSVRTVTLDSIAAEFGTPRFVKIDVEGHELATLLGMSFRPPALSFEVHGSMLDEADQSLRLLEASGYTFRLSIGKSFEWSGPWQPRHPLLDSLGSLAKVHPRLFADVYATTEDAPHT
jgi:FkbM family methyltransferase